MNTCPFSNFKEDRAEIIADSKRRTIAYEKLIRQSFPSGNKVEGLFGPGSMHWKIYRCPAVILGAYSALLAQIAHPAVADGVAKFSQFSKDYLGRAERTFTSMIKIYFGDQVTAMASGRKLHQIHNFIRGTIKVNVDGKEIVEEYCANNPHHLCWVQATLVHTSIQVYQMVNRKLSDVEKEKFFEESLQTALVMGIPKEIYPSNYIVFKAYYESMETGEYLRVDKTTKDLTKVIFDPPYVPGWLAKIFAAALLPLKLRTAFDLKYTPMMKTVFSVIMKLAALFTKLTPAPFGFTPPFYQAHYRIAKFRGIRPKRSTQFFNYLSSFQIFKAVRL